MCSMYTATLTGAITAAVYNENDFSFVQKKVSDFASYNKNRK